MAKSLTEILSAVQDLAAARTASDNAHDATKEASDEVTAAQEDYSHALAAEGTAKTRKESLAAQLVADIQDFANASSDDIPPTAPSAPASPSSPSTP